MPPALISEVLEKMIDSQIANTEALTTLKEYLHECKETWRSCNEKLSLIDKHFSNGFRSELKQHVTSEIERSLREIEALAAERSAQQRVLLEEVGGLSKRLDVLNQTLESFKSMKFWLKLLFGLIVAIAGIAAAVKEILSVLP